MMDRTGVGSHYVYHRLEQSRTSDLRNFAGDECGVLYEGYMYLRLQNYVYKYIRVEPHLNSA